MVGDTKKKNWYNPQNAGKRHPAKKIRAQHYATHINHVWNTNNRQIDFGDIKVVNNMN